MKKTYIKPQLCVVATNADALLNQTSWKVYSDDPSNKDDYGNIIYDKGAENYKEGEYDPWKEGLW